MDADSGPLCPTQWWTLNGKQKVMIKWTQIAGIFDTAITKAVMASKGNRILILNEARERALSLCQDDSEKREVECRALEARMLAAAAKIENAGELKSIVEEISMSENFSECRKVEIGATAEAVLRRWRMK